MEGLGNGQYWGSYCWIPKETLKIMLKKPKQTQKRERKRHRERQRERKEGRERERTGEGKEGLLRSSDTP